MSVKKSEFRKYMEQAGELPADVVLGWIVIYQVRDANYDRSMLEQTFDELGMNPGLIPAPNNPLHAYMKATSSVNDIDYALPRDQHAHVLVRDQMEDKEVVVRQLTREIRDIKRGRLGYAKIGECAFYRPVSRNGKVDYGTERIRLTVDNSALTNHERPVLQKVLDKIANEYDRHINYMDAMKYRAVIRDYLLHLNALKIKDGFYFVHNNRGDELSKLRTLVERLGGGSTMFVLPLVDLDSQRDMVVQAYLAEAEEALNDIVKQVMHVRGTRKSVTPAAYAKIKREYEQVINRSKEYGRTLKVSATTTAAAEELALEALAALQNDLLEGSK